MKNFRRLCFAIVLTMAFSIPALAGDMPGPTVLGDMGGPTSPVADTPTSTAPGDVHVPGAPSPGSPDTSTSTDPGDIHIPGFTILRAILGII